MAELPEVELDRWLDQCERKVTIVTVGRLGAGKSSLLNKVFEVGKEDASLGLAGNVECRYVVAKNKIELHIVELSHENRNKYTLKQLRRLSIYTENKVDLVLFCIPVGPDTRFDNDNLQLMRTLQQRYGQNIWRHCLVVFTFSNLVWDYVKRQEATTKIYIEYITRCTDHFREELIKMKVEKQITDSVKTIFDVAEDQPRPTIVTVPAGYDGEDPILPGINLEENEKWVGRLFMEMLLSASNESKLALLEFRYTREVTYRGLSSSHSSNLKQVIHTIQRRPEETELPRSDIKPTTTSELPTHPKVKQFLKILSTRETITVGTYLGLYYRTLKSIREEDILDETISRWLKEDDDVTETSGHPSWLSLVKALYRGGWLQRSSSPN